MNTNLKTANTTHAEATHGFYRVAIVGAASLKGKELAEIIEQRNFPAAEVKLLDDDETLGQLEAIRDEVTFIQSVRAEQFEHIDFTFFASDSDNTAKIWKQAQHAGSTIVDLSYGVEDDSGAMVRAPWLEKDLKQSAPPELEPGPAIIAHPAAIALGLIMTRLQSAVHIQQATAIVLQPASEYGQRGMDELHQQTVNLLSFQPLPKELFDVQIAFNLVARFGAASGQSLSKIEQRIEKHFREIAGAETLLPSLFTLQAPVFHSHGIGLNIRLQSAEEIEKVSNALSGEHISIVPASQESPNNVNAAGQGDIMISIVPDTFNLGSVWLWVAFDNLRVSATNAVECAESMAPARPRGQIQ